MCWRKVLWFRATTLTQVAANLAPLRDPSKPSFFPLPICTFLGGHCGAVQLAGTVAVLPLDEDGREIVKPQYAFVDDFKFGFAQVDVDGKSGLIDRNGRIRRAEVRLHMTGKKKPSHPDYRGEAAIRGKRFWVSAWNQRKRRQEIYELGLPPR